MTKYIFITGGVSSSLGKGIATSSIACLLEYQKISIALMKIDPYINIDSGTLSPYQHGEVYVTQDGAETDLDLGNYERFTHYTVSKINSITTGQIYQSVINKERRGEYQGNTVQVIPHITDEIKSRIHRVAKESRANILLVEIGGTVGDIESIPFLEAIRQFASDVHKENVLYIHLTLIPIIASTGEQKTKPTQHSVKELRTLGINPDILLCRSAVALSQDMKDKLALLCDVKKSAIIQALDVENIYEVPLQYHHEGLIKIICEKFRLKTHKTQLKEWQKIIQTESRSEHSVDIGIIGKYSGHHESYTSIAEALRHGAIANKIKVRINYIDATSLNTENLSQTLSTLHGLFIAGGFGSRGVEGKILACHYGRIHQIPTFAVCLGMQCMLIEFARKVCALPQAHSTEFQKDTPHPVVSLLPEQEHIQTLGGTMHLGLGEIFLQKKSRAYQIYQNDPIHERHRHRYEFNSRYRIQFETHGLCISGWNRKSLVEIIELATHPWYIGVQFHPEYQSKPIQAHPLFISFIQTAFSLSVPAR